MDAGERELTSRGSGAAGLQLRQSLRAKSVKVGHGVMWCEWAFKIDRENQFWSVLIAPTKLTWSTQRSCWKCELRETRDYVIYFPLIFFSFSNYRRQPDL